MIWRDPWSSTTLMRDAMLRIWRARGGGLYGFGYLVAFVLMEVRLVIGEFGTSSGVLDFLGNQLLEYLFRICFMSVVNMLLAFIWPLLLLEHTGPWGIVALALGFLVFERWLRPSVEARLPELRNPNKRRRHSGGDDPVPQQKDGEAERRDS